MRILVNQDEISIFRTRMMMQMNNIEEELNKMELLKKDLIWQGEAYKKFLNKYDENISDIKRRMESLIKYIDFLNKFNRGYNNAQENIRDNYSRSRVGNYYGK